MDMSDVKDYEKYAYPMGHSKARGTRLIPKKHMMEFAALESLEALLKGLEDTDYGPFLTRARSSGRYEEAIEKGLAAELDDLTRVLGNEKRWVADIFRIKYNFNNFKLFFKSRFAEKKEAPQFSFFGTIPPKKFEAMWPASDEEILRNLEEPYKSALEKAIAAYRKEGDTKLFDHILDKRMFEYVFKVIPEDLEGSFFREYFSLEIDIHNLLTLLRLKREKKEDSLDEFFIEYGGVRKERIKNLEISGTACGKLWESVRDEYEKTGSLTKLERLATAYTMRFVYTRSILRPFTPEGIAAYILMKEQEALNVRLLIGLKAKEVPPKLAEQLIGEEYA